MFESTINFDKVPDLDTVQEFTRQVVESGAQVMNLFFDFQEKTLAVHIGAPKPLEFKMMFKQKSSFYCSNWDD